MKYTVFGTTVREHNGKKCAKRQPTNTESAKKRLQGSKLDIVNWDDERKRKAYDGLLRGHGDDNQ